MSRDRGDQEPAFKVVDRRRFTEEGNLRSQNDDEKHPSPAEKTLPSSSLLNEKTDVARPAMNFSFFIETLAHQAMMALGIFPWPDSSLIKVDLIVAKETIDIIQMLKEKTLGNTTKDEQVLLDNLLYQLQLAFVEISQKKPSSGPPSQS